MTSSSSAYDVFLSFRGTDTRNNFTSHLYKALCDKNIKTFIDNSIERGEEITSFLEGIIEGVKLSIIVFSLDYASSTYCLDEMVKIIECKETKARIVLPIFYKVYPSEEMYNKAFARHEKKIKQETMVGRLVSFILKVLHWATFYLTFERYEEIISKETKVERWRSSFQKALELASWHIDDNSNEAAVIQEITIDVSKRLNCLSKGEELICTSLVGETARNNFQNIWECLMNDEISRVGIYGMGGVGKTTIVTRINNQLLEVANSFTHIYWVTVSKDLSIYKLQSGIAKKINMDLSKEDDERRRAALIQKELSNKKFVLILDDVWEAYELTKDVGLPCLVGGQKLLLTSRSRRVCERMECLPIEVKPLCEKEALDLFIKESMYQINDSPVWGGIVDSIVKECGGLPLAIVVIARSMKGVKEIWIWRNILRELQKPCEGGNPEMEEKVFKVLKLSYDRLRSDMCRQCFLYCSLFPEDHRFYRKDLIEYWIGEGLIDGLVSRYEELDRSNCILDELIHASLLESMHFGEMQQVKMHDLIRDMARMNVKVGLQFPDPFESVQVATGRMLKNFFESTPHCSKLRTLVLRHEVMKELPSCFVVNTQSLYVLHMTDSLASIPDSIGSLRNLIVLIIEFTYVECIPSLAELEKLQHLKISCNVMLKEIPNDIERLVNLRVLDLSRNSSLDGSFLSGAVEKLSHLQTLNLSGSRVEVEPEVLISLKKLEVLKLHFYNLHKLNCYVKSTHWRRLLEYHIHYGEQIILGCDGLMNLKIMSFKSIRKIEEWKGGFGIFLPYDIQYLKLLGWESSMFYVLHKRTFVHLKSVHIKIIRYKSRYLFTVELAQHLLHNVQHLEIDNGDELVEIIGREEEWINPSKCMSYPTILLPNLKILDLSSLGKLRSIYNGRMMCSSLELILITKCNKLERLPFCMENEGNNTIQLESKGMSSKWWDSLMWDDHHAKSMYNFQNYSGDCEDDAA